MPVPALGGEFGGGGIRPDPIVYLDQASKLFVHRACGIRTIQDLSAVLLTLENSEPSQQLQLALSWPQPQSRQPSNSANVKRFIRRIVKERKYGSSSFAKKNPAQLVYAACYHNSDDCNCFGDARHC
jgi:hypothetical protein